MAIHFHAFGVNRSGRLFRSPMLKAVAPRDVIDLNRNGSIWSAPAQPSGDGALDFDYTNDPKRCRATLPPHSKFSWTMETTLPSLTLGLSDTAA